MKIRLHNLDRQYRELETSLIIANTSALSSGKMMLGDYTLAFEERIAKVAGAKYCVTVGSGSDALQLGLVACGVMETTIPAQTYIATQNSVLRAGAICHYADVMPNGLIDWNTIKTRDVVWVGLFGNLETLPKDINIYEDGAQHFGHKLQGIFASYSFDPTKSLPNYGNGGAIVTNDKRIADTVQNIRRHGTTEDFTGGHSLMSERECSEMLIKLDHFPFWQERRQELARDYTDQLNEIEGLDIITNPDSLVSKMVISTPLRPELEYWLFQRGIETKRVYEQALAYKPGAIYNCNAQLSIPCDPHTTDEELLEVILCIKEFFTEFPFES